MTLTIALAGNPNCGKTTLFNALTGSSQRVGNWPGVTIDKKVGRIRGCDAELVDLPGIYSLSPYSPEEIVSRNYIVNEKPDAIINIVDATNLERNLYLSLQIIDMGIPMVIAMNMMDEVEKAGDHIDSDLIAKSFGISVIPISAAKKENIDKLVGAIMDAATSRKVPPHVIYDDTIESTAQEAENALKGKVPEENIRFYAFKLIDDDPLVNESVPGARESIMGSIRRMEEEYDDSADSIIADSRYRKITEVVDAAVKRAPRDERGSLSDRVDRIVTHRIIGIPIFIVVIAMVYFLALYDGESFTSPGAWATGCFNDWFAEMSADLSEWCDENDVSEITSGILIDGIMAGVGAVLGFLPQIAIMFTLLIILEEVGYMARVAFVMDRIFRYFNLSGKSFIPLLVGTGCGVPGVMSARTIESESDRRITAMTVTFMPCSAKLPIISAIAGALAGNMWVAVYAYFMGIVLVIFSGIILKKFKRLAGNPAPFIMELPPYHIPKLYGVLKGIFDRCWAFVKKAFTVVLLASVIIWFLCHFDFALNYLDPETEMEDSILATLGGYIAYIFIPLGWENHWELAASTITGLMAKENIVATLGVVLVGDSEATISSVSDALAVMLGNEAAILSFFSFNIFCAPCVAAIGAIHRELDTWGATGLAVLYQCTVSYCIAIIVYAVYGTIIGVDIDWYTYALAAVDVVILAYLLVAKDPFRQKREAKA
ncbi:MAG: ferrous iron transport protein B [Thermoplasmata archaeon]|nr:ferrous iron transport protein B [Thermoplasmata archaeon]